MTKRIFLLIKIVALLQFLPAGVHAQKDSIDLYIESQMKQQRIVGLAIGIIKEGKIVKTKGYGYANLEYQIPVTPNTIYKLASVSKHMIAVGVLKLAEEGKLNLNDPVSKYFPDAPAHWNKITVRHLLNHTSGLERESPAFRSMEVKSDSILIRAAYKDTLVFATGTSWQYCNLGYFMLADIIRQLSGKSFSRYMKEDIFSRYGLTSTQTTSLTDLIPGRADGYVVLRGDTVLNAENNIALRPSGAFLSNITDMIKWEMIMQSNQIISKNSWQRMWQDTVKTTFSNNEGSQVYYGYGWNVTTYKNRKLFAHGGSLQGFRTVYFRFPDEKTAVIILTNSEPTNTTPIAQGVADIIFGK